MLIVEDLQHIWGRKRIFIKGRCLQEKLSMAGIPLVSVDSLAFYVFEIKVLETDLSLSEDDTDVYN